MLESQVTVQAHVSFDKAIRGQLVAGIANLAPQDGMRGWLSGIAGLARNRSRTQRGTRWSRQASRIPRRAR